jgi:hypothetical protein
MVKEIYENNHVRAKKHQHKHKLDGSTPKYGYGPRNAMLKKQQELTHSTDSDFTIHELTRCKGFDTLVAKGE